MSKKESGFKKSCQCLLVLWYRLQGDFLHSPSTQHRPPGPIHQDLHFLPPLMASGANGLQLEVFLDQHEFSGPPKKQLKGAFCAKAWEKTSSDLYQAPITYIFKGSRITSSQKSFKKNQIKYDQICSQEVGKSKNNTSYRSCCL